MLEFRLVYKGLLPADTGSGGRAKYKHQIRRCFHQQLRELWKHQASLREQAELRFCKLGKDKDGKEQIYLVKDRDRSSYPQSAVKTWLEHLADDHQRVGTRWVPLVNKSGGFTCSLDILFLRRDNPGGIVVRGIDGGDVDNRIKTLIDGLKMAEQKSDLGGETIDLADEDPFYCLLDDDRLITGITVTTDRLLVPPEPGEKPTEVELIIGVKIISPDALFVGNKLV